MNIGVEPKTLLLISAPISSNKNHKNANKSAFSIKTEINPYSLKYGAYKAYLTERINTI